MRRGGIKIAGLLRHICATEAKLIDRTPLKQLEVSFNGNACVTLIPSARSTDDAPIYIRSVLSGHSRPRNNWSAPNLMIIVIASTEMSLCNCQRDHCRSITIREPPAHGILNGCVDPSWLPVCRRTSNCRSREKEKISILIRLPSRPDDEYYVPATLFRLNNAEQLIRSEFVRKLKSGQSFTRDGEMRAGGRGRKRQMIEESTRAICNPPSICRTRIDCCGNQFCLKRTDIIHTSQQNNEIAAYRNSPCSRAERNNNSRLKRVKLSRNKARLSADLIKLLVCPTR